MKKKPIYLLFIATIALFASCSTSKEARTYKKTIDGNWQLKSITTQGIQGSVKVMLFNEADFNCFVGSTWSFNDRNSLGTYTIMQNGSCPGIKRDFRWTIYEAPNEPKLFQFKRLDSKLKSMDDGAGFRFNIDNIDDNSMQFKSTINFENKEVALIYKFVRI